MSDQVNLQTLTFAEQNRRRRDPFGWILMAMGVSLLVGVPALWLVLVLGGPISNRVLFGTLVVLMALLALAAAGVAVSGKGVTRHSIRDLFWLTLSAALGCSMVIYTDVLVRVGFLFALIAITTLWWTEPMPREARSEYFLRLAGNFILITVMIMVIMGGSSTALTMMVQGHGR